MVGKQRNLLGIVILLVGLCCPGTTGAVMAGEATGEDAAIEPVLLGPASRQEIESAMPEWMTEVVLAEPDRAAANLLVGALEGAEVTIFFGTWCADSGRELPRLWRALDEAGAIDPAEIRYIGVDRDKTEPAELVSGRDLQRVPTIVVMRAGIESGRIVESSPSGIEIDLLALLRGETKGSVTGSPELAGERDEP